MESCCQPAISINTINCPQCHLKGTPVGQKTLLNLLKAGQKCFVGEGKYFFCATPHCSIVYYNNEDSLTFAKDDLKIRVGIKEILSPIPVCYCFNITKEDIREEIIKTGFSTASKRIQAGVKKGGCACDLNNPSGRCCLKDVKNVEEQLKGERDDLKIRN